MKKGTKVRVNSRHAGAEGSTGRISRIKPQRINGHTYYAVKLTGGRARGWTMLFTGKELERI